VTATPPLRVEYRKFRPGFISGFGVKKPSFTAAQAPNMLRLSDRRRPCVLPGRDLGNRSIPEFGLRSDYSAAATGLRWLLAKSHIICGMLPKPGQECPPWKKHQTISAPSASGPTRQALQSRAEEYALAS